MSFEIDVSIKMRDWPEVTRAGVQITARDVRMRSRENLRGVGFSRFAKGTNTKMSKIEGGYMVQVFQTPTWMKVFEYGGTSVGRPLLWIPVDPTLKGVRARTVSGLYRPGSKRNKRPVLVSKRDGKVKYIGISAVTNRPRLKIRDIAKREAEAFVQRLVE